MGRCQCYEAVLTPSPRFDPARNEQPDRADNGARASAGRRMIKVGALATCVLAAAGAATALLLLRLDHRGVLATAAIDAGDKPALVRFMRDMGYPKHGEWCGEFAASIVARAGGIPPDGATLASNWRRYGSADATPRVGDVAVADRGVPTGETGSHVGFVTGIHLNDGTFTLESGNASSIFTTRKISCFSFHRPPGRVLAALIGNGIPPEAAVGRPPGRVSIGADQSVSATGSPDRDDCGQQSADPQESADTESPHAAGSAGGPQRAQRACPFCLGRESAAYRNARSCTAATQTSKQCPRFTARAAACLI